MTKLERKILHIDMDAFYAAIEQRDNPDLKGFPVIIGSRHPRSVVSTASYEARKFGVHSAMPMMQALKLCSQAICIPPDLKKYQKVSEKIMGIFNNYTDLVEALSLDEAFLDVSGSQRIFGKPIEIAQSIKKDIMDQVGLTCSIGISYNKFLAKLASDLEKPNGITVINREDLQRKVWPLSIKKMWGIGPKSSEKLEQCNIRTIGQLAQTDINFLQSILGSWGTEVHHLANGLDNRPVVPQREAQSIGHETTFSKDTKDLEFIKTVLLDLAQEVGRRLRGGKIKGKTIVLKLRYNDFKTITRNHTLIESTNKDDLIYRTVLDLFKANYDQNKSLRLIGITATALTTGDEPNQISLFPVENDKSNVLYQALDNINSKYGEKTVTRARLVRKN